MRRQSVGMAGIALVLIASVAAAQPPRGPGRAGGGRFGGPGGFPGSMLLGSPEVQKELELKDEQKTQVNALLGEMRDQMRASFGNFNPREFQDLSQEERQKRLEEFRKKAEESSKKADEKLATILDAKQRERFGQLRLQREGVAAFNRPELAKQLGLSEEQQGKIRKLQEQMRPQGRGGFGGQELSDEQRREFFTRMRERREKAQADILAVLTDEQKAKWTELKGKEFKFPEPQGRFGPGGGNEPRRRPARKTSD